MPQKTEEKKMLLEQLYNISLQTEELFLKSEIDEAVSLIQRKDKIIKSLSFLKEIKDESFKELTEKIKIQEEKNIELSKSIKNKIQKELTGLKKTSKMNNLYSQTDFKGSIVDILE